MDTISEEIMDITYAEVTISLCGFTSKDYIQD